MRNPAEMGSYSVFGGRLDSTLEFPELARASGMPATWQLDVRDTAPPDLAAAEELGEDNVYGDVRVRCYRTAEGYALVFDDTGRFDVSQDGGSIRWYRPADANEEAARADVLGRVLALALHARGTLSLHASAVSVAGHGIAFIAPKHHGKSTLTAALVGAGGRLVSDDVVPIRLDDVPCLLPGVQYLRLWDDAAMAALRAPTREDISRKRLIKDLGHGMTEDRPVPLASAYILFPTRADSGSPAVTREALPPVDAAMQLVQHAKLGPLLRRAEAAQLFSQAATLAHRVTVHVLSVQRDLARLDEVVGELLAWNRAAGHEATGNW
jgi:hypothetical protein